MILEVLRGREEEEYLWQVFSSLLYKIILKASGNFLGSLWHFQEIFDVLAILKKIGSCIALVETSGKFLVVLKGLCFFQNFLNI